MYPTTDKYKQTVYQEDIQHLLNIYINNKEIKIDYDTILEFNLSTSLFSEELTLGSMPAKTIELKLYKQNLNNSIKNIYIETGVNDQIVPIGYFIVDSIEEDEDIIKIKAIDYMIKFEFNYDGSKLTYPCSILTVLQDICSKSGVELRFYFFFEYE